MESLSKQLDLIDTWFRSHGDTLGFAESCTGGLLSSLLTARPGVSQYFMGSVISYHGKIKRDLLQVPEALLQEFGEVSEPVSAAMAAGARRVLQCDWSVSITGIAGPTGGSATKPIGLVWFAVHGPSFEYTESRVFKDAGLETQKAQAQTIENKVLSQREKIQLASAHYALQLLWKGVRSRKE